MGRRTETRDVRGQRLVARGVGDETRQPDRRGDEGFGRACHQWSSPLDDDLGDVLAALTEPLTTPPGMSRWVIWIAIGCFVGDPDDADANSVPLSIEVMVPANSTWFVADVMVAVPLRTMRPPPSLVPCSTTTSLKPGRSVKGASNCNVSAWFAPSVRATVPTKVA